jgi:hypothetical protein
MKMCKPHWDQLRSAIDARGLTALVAENNKVATERIKAQLDPNSPDNAGFDPLMNANFAIWSNALEQGGGYLIFGDENGNPYCPLCESEKHGGYPADWYITHAADDQLQRARELKLIPPIQ